MNVIIFGGPTVSEEEVKAILADARYLPPVKHAQLLCAVHYYKPDVIGIVDGIIDTDLSIWHKEILYSLDNGIRVYGAGGMGAIRAAELHKFGMIGIGRVFEDYQNGRIENDDEVFVKFSRENGEFVRLSEPLVNIRETFKKALQEKIIDDLSFRMLMEIAGSLYYPQRTFRRVYQRALEKGMEGRIIEGLQRFTSDCRIDLVKQDALEMLRAIDGLGTQDLTPGKKARDSYSMLFAPLYERDRSVRWEEVEFPLYYISNFLCMYHPEVEALNYRGLNREIALYLADIMQIQVNEEDVRMEIARFRKKHRLEDDENFEKWLRENDMAERDTRSLFEKQARLRKMHHWFFTSRRQFIKNTGYLLEELKLDNKYVKWKAKVGMREQIVQETTPGFKQAFSKEDFAALFQDYIDNRIPWNIPVKEAANEMGIRLNDIKIELLKDRLYKEKMLAAAVELFKD